MVHDTNLAAVEARGFESTKQLSVKEQKIVRRRDSYTVYRLAYCLLSAGSAG